MVSISATLAQGVDFVEGPLKATLKKAKAEKKLVFVDCYTAWCIPCANMAKNVFPQKACGDYFNETFVSTKFDMEKGEGLELQKQWKCVVYPTFIILDADGKEVNRLTGATLNADEFVEKVKAAINPDNSVEKLKEAYEANKSMMPGLAYAKAMYDKGHNVADILEDVYMHSHEYDRYNTEFLIYYLGSIDFRSEKFDRLMVDKNMWNSRLGREVVDRMIFDTYRKPMYIVAAGRPHDYTAADVRKAAMLTSFLSLPFDNTEIYLPAVASCVMDKDWDRFIDIYERRIFRSGEDSYKVIMLGFVSQYYPQFSDEQKARIKKDIENLAKNGSYNERNFNSMLQRFDENK